MTKTPVSVDDPSAPDLVADPADAGARRLRARREALAEPRSLLALIPRRNLTKLVLLVIFLAVIVALQQQSGAIVKQLEEGLFPAPPAAQAPAREAPRVRLAVPVTAP